MGEKHAKRLSSTPRSCSQTTQNATHEQSRVLEPRLLEKMRGLSRFIGCGFCIKNKPGELAIQPTGQTNNSTRPAEKNQAQPFPIRHPDQDPIEMLLWNSSNSIRPCELGLACVDRR
mmetsp:Transcript_95621/g.209116  ORF Transcript_95621/g.209116 Transcript_95621/m.209116 type:complete len:117 (+) Transcript_95621:119-469(+)